MCEHVTCKRVLAQGQEVALTTLTCVLSVQQLGVSRCELLSVWSKNRHPHLVQLEVHLPQGYVSAERALVPAVHLTHGWFGKRGGRTPVAKYALSDKHPCNDPFRLCTPVHYNPSSPRKRVLSLDAESTVRRASEYTHTPPPPRSSLQTDGLRGVEVDLVHGSLVPGQAVD